MKLYLGMDDTDVLGADMGTGKLIRIFADRLPPGVRMWSVVRHQLFFDKRIPFTSHNSSACAIIDIPDSSALGTIQELAAQHIREKACAGSDPGLCVARECDDLSEVIEFGVRCTFSIETQDRAKAVAEGCAIHLSGHGGTNDGIIGALAAVGLTAHGWSGRLIDRGGQLRALPNPVSVAELLTHGITPISLDRDAVHLPPDTLIHTNGWLRPRLCAGRAVLPVRLHDGKWMSLGGKRAKG